MSQSNIEVVSKETQETAVAVENQAIKEAGIRIKRLSELFNLTDEDSHTREMFQFIDNTDPLIPPINPQYTFRKESVRELLSFLAAPNGDALFITGPTGSGKTSLVLQAAARLNWPVESVTINGRMEFAELRGLFTVCSLHPGEAPQTIFKYGPLVNAMRNGHILLLNELDLADPAEIAGLNDVLEGRPLIIAENGGEVIYPHPWFRVIATGNSAGGGDDSGLYQGVVTQNLASMDRFRFMKVNYADPAVEKRIIARAVPTFPSSDLDKLIQLANDVRKCFMGQKEGSNRISITMSTRTVLRWAYLTMQMNSVRNPLKYALNLALLNRANENDSAVIGNLCKAVFGRRWDTPISN